MQENPTTAMKRGDCRPIRVQERELEDEERRQIALIDPDPDLKDPKRPRVAGVKPTLAQGLVPTTHSLSEECPNCGAPYSEPISVEMGDRYADVLGRTPRSFLTDYIRICSDPEEGSAGVSTIRFRPHRISPSPLEF